MRTLTRFFLCALALMALVAVMSCSSIDDPTQGVESESHSCRMIFNVTKPFFADEQDTRSSTQWENGDEIYLLFSSANGLVHGDAVYNDGEWNVNYNGNLTKDQEANCRAYYFENRVSYTHAEIALDENTAIFEDTVAKYTYSDGSLSVTANLKPKTGRIRFKGTNHEEIKVYGITHNTSFNRFTGEYSTTKGIIKTKVDGEYTPYTYGEFTDSIEPRVNIWRDTDGFTRLFPSTIFKVGDSGFVTIPTPTSHNGWQTNVTFKINGVEFTMIPVEHSNGNFLMAQTETTEALYEAVMNDGKNSLLPKTDLSYSDWDIFVTTINSKMELSFSIPSEEKWKYAAKGGNKSLGFTYSGSNSIDEVAWYKDNAKGKIHEVATKQPNELGFYDMSGNVSEYTGQYYSAKNHFYGGNFEDNSKNCELTSFDYSVPLYKAGLRLCMINNDK